MSKEELVNHPSHYNIEGRKECWDEFIDKFGPEYTYIWCLLTVHKYLYRKGLKSDNPKEQDIKKAYAYFNKAYIIRHDYDLKEYAEDLYKETASKILDII